jgi:hypothetical protein
LTDCADAPVAATAAANIPTANEIILMKITPLFD